MKKFNYLVVALAFAFGLTNQVKALTAVEECITSAGTHTCVLSEDVEVSAQLQVQGNIELDLNGYTMMPASTTQIAGGLVGVKRGATLTIKDTAGNGKITSGNSGNVYAAVQVTVKNESAEGDAATLIVDGGTLEGYYYAITGNGNRHNTVMVINDGNIIALGDNTGDGTGIYHPESGNLTINGGLVQGPTGIEMRAGNLTVNGGIIEGTATPVEVTPNGSGTTTKGAGIAISQHTTLKDIDVKIKNGTVRGFTAVYESNPQNNANVEEQVSINITGGNFEAINEGQAVVYSEDLEGFITRGTFNKELEEEYIIANADVKQANGNYVIGADNATDIDSNEDLDIDTTYDATSYVAPIETYDVNLSWDDLHWIFVYEGEITSPVREVWLTKEVYDAMSANSQAETTNEFNGELLDDIANLEDANVEIIVENNSTFAVDVLATVEQKTSANYTNPAGLQIALDGQNVTYDDEANVSALATSDSAVLLVKPTASRFVNDDGVTANVTGEVKLTFTKSN